MNNSLEKQYRRFLHLMAGFAFLGTITELWFLEHTESTVQLLPFFLCGLGLISIFLVFYFPTRKVLYVYRIVMVVIAFGGFIGFFQHLKNNIAFELEIRPNAIVSDVFWEALKGASPIMAPGILTFAAVMGYAATWKYYPFPDDT